MKYTHPFNVTSYVLGTLLLIVGSFYSSAPDWDVSISLIMSVFCYMFATPTILAILNRDWTKLLVMGLATWWTVDGCYYLYWSYVDPSVLILSRDVNWPASLALYGSAGVVWLIPTLIEGTSRTGR